MINRKTLCFADHRDAVASMMGRREPTILVECRRANGQAAFFVTAAGTTDAVELERLYGVEPDEGEEIVPDSGELRCRYRRLP